MNELMLSIIRQRLAERALQPAPVMIPEIAEMKRLIGNLAFAMMGAYGIMYDNAKYMLQWQIRGSAIQTIQFIYDPGWDTYSLCFITYAKVTNAPSTEKIDGLFCEDIRETIERKTGLFLSL